MHRAAVSAIAAAACASMAAAARPNFVFFQTDDQDYTLGSLSVMRTVQQALVQQGMLFTHSYVSTPVCCPSRTSMWSGQYAHALDDQRLGWCGTYPSNETNTWLLNLRQSGYETYLGGKYHNDYAAFCGANVHVPPQLSSIFAFCVDSKYFNITYNQDGKMVATGDTPADYMTAVIGNHSVAWIAKAAATAAAGGAPFFAYIGTHAPHVPATVAPWYEDAPLPATSSPRTPNWNAASPDKEWLLATAPEMSPAMIEASDQHFQRRLRSLLSVDDIVAAVVDTLKAAGVADNTYLIYSSDHGYQLGQMRLPAEKFHVYEHDVRVPLIIAGPGVPSATVNDALVVQLDIGATILDLAGLPIRPGMDGASLKQLAMGAGAQALPTSMWNAITGAPSASTSTVLLDAGVPANPPGVSGWRQKLLIEYYGCCSPQGDYVWRGPCNNFSTACPPGDIQALVQAPSTTYTALRVRNASMDQLFVEFRPRSTPPSPATSNFTEAYDLSSDAFQMTNVAYPGNGDGSMPAPVIAAWRSELYAAVNCSGSACILH